MSPTLNRHSLLLLGLLAAPLAAPAQEMGLDLTEEAPAPKPAPKPRPQPKAEQPPPSHGAELGLDLGASPPPRVDYRPPLAVLGVWSLPLPGAPGHVDGGRAERLAEAFVKGAQAARSFKSVLDPSQVARKLAGHTAELSGCTAANCFEELAETLSVERVFSAQMLFGEREITARLLAYDRGTGEVKQVSLSEPGKALGLEKQVWDAYQKLLKGLAVELSHLHVTCQSDKAIVTLGGRPLGSGTVDVLVSAGRYQLAVSDPSYLPYQTSVVLEPRGSSEIVAPAKPLPTPVDADLQAALRADARRAGSGSLAGRPSVWLAGAGAAALLAGVGFGAMGGSFERRAWDSNGDGVIDITRAEAVAARRYGKIANILFAVGGVAFGSGAIWFLVEPGAPSPQAGAAPSLREASLTLAAGGTF